MSRPAYVLDHAEARAIAREWGAEGELEIIRRRQTFDHRTGLWTVAADANAFHRYTTRSDDPAENHHRIVLVSQLDRFKVAHSLAHELQHAVQATEACRRGGVSAWRDYCREHRHLPHDDRPYEIEAEAKAEGFWRAVYRRVVRSRGEHPHGEGGGRRPTDVPAAPFRIAAEAAVEAGASWQELAAFAGWTEPSRGQRLRRALGLRGEPDKFVRYETGERLMLALNLDPYECGL